MDLQLIIANQSACIEQQAAIIKSYEDFKITMEEKYATLLFNYENLCRQVFGKKSERFIPDLSNAPNLFSHLDTEEVKAEESIKEQVTEHVSYTRKKTNHKGRTLIQNHSHLRCETTILTLENTEEYLSEIGSKVKDLLAISPADLYIKREQSIVYKNTATGEIVYKPFTEQGIACEADTSLLAHLPVSKYVDHLPEYRLQQQLKRQEIVIPSSTMNDWMHKVAESIKVVAEQTKQDILSGNYIQIDESSIPVLFEKKGSTHKGYMWVVIDPKTKNTYFEYQPGKDKEVPKLMLKDYKGTLQSDGYQVYEYVEGIYQFIDHCCCWAHSRRKFTEALNSNKEKTQEALVLIQKLYEIERHCREIEYSEEQRKEYRHKYSMPILNELKDWLDQKSLTILPKSPLGKAITYCLKRWDKLIKFAHSGDIEIDNNNVENAIRPLALGRKNYLFAGGHEAARHTSYFYTIFSTCKAIQVNPYNYLKWYLDQLPYIKVNQIANYTPVAYKNLGI